MGAMNGNEGTNESGNTNFQLSQNPNGTNIATKIIKKKDKKLSLAMNIPNNK